jgi:hypothetical protein
MKTKCRLVTKISFVLLTAAITLFSCNSTPYYFRSNYTNANQLIHEEGNLQTKQFLKAHLKDGGVIILKDSWNIDTLQNIITGNGTKYDIKRKMTFEGAINIPISSVAIFETNKKLKYDESSRIASLSILAGLDVIMGVICITNPKACFGSCPTFYINPSDNFHYADAEGFSHATFPSSEYFDIDALPKSECREKNFSITMKNEALETHCVNDVKLFVYPVQKGESVYQTRDNEFYLCENKYRLKKATGSEGDITSLLLNDDRNERFSLSDKDNLKSSEEIILTFDSVSNLKKPGLLINFRQTLMTTYFIYSSMGYMGEWVGDAYAIMEAGKIERKSNKKFYEELGDIDVYVWSESKNTWIFQGGWYETGPIAVNKQLLPLKTENNSNSLKLKLVMNRGLWRIDYLALINIKAQVKPIEIEPDEIINRGHKDDKALAMIKDPGKYLISMPGDEYTFHFEFPEEENYELFLYSKGYYLEWMRNDWIKDKDLPKLRLLVKNPDKYFRKQAAEYKTYETIMEQLFWNSKIDTKIFSYHEN